VCVGSVAAKCAGSTTSTRFPRKGDNIGFGIVPLPQLRLEIAVWPNFVVKIQRTELIITQIPEFKHRTTAQLCHFRLNKSADFPMR
jgi:hypothetical protein